MKEAVKDFEYEGNLFKLIKNNGWYSSHDKYTVTGIHIVTSELRLPDICCGIPVEEWKMREDSLEGGEKVRSLRIPACMAVIEIDNAFFPELERIMVEPDSRNFSTDGRMLFSGDGSKLLYVLAEGCREKAVIPKSVKKIEKNAFANTKCGEILFENPDVTAEAEAFRNSHWLKGQKGYAVIGNMFFSLLGNMDELRVPEGVRRFHARAFADAVPGHLITPVQPMGKCIEDLDTGRYEQGKSYRCREITLLSRRARVNLSALRKFRGLSAVHIPEGHVRYCSVDGVIYSKDRTVLEYYPPAREDAAYKIADGTVKIAKTAFAGNDCLRELWMPESVAAVGMGAFQNCVSLREIRFSPNIKEFPDASAYQNGGVFEGCRALKKAVLPEKLQYLGSYAFYESALQEIQLNGNLRQMGEYALGAQGLREVSLPPSLERLGKGALLYAERISAYEGTARGLVAAVNAVLPDVSEKRANVEWKRCKVTVYRRRSDKSEVFLIPGSLKLNMAYHLDMAWNGDTIDYEEYDACFEAVTEGEERMEFAQLGILRLGKEEDSPYVNYMKHSALKLASSLLRQGKEKEFLAFLKKDYLSEGALVKLLKLTNEQEMTTCSAYLLEYLNRKGRKSQRRFIL